MGKLLTDDGGGRAEPRHHGHGEGGADGQAVDEVVQRVAQGDHPGHRLDAGDALPSQPVAHHTVHLDILEKRQDRFRSYRRRWSYPARI